MTFNKKHSLIFLAILVILLTGMTIVSATEANDANNTQKIRDNKILSTPAKYDVDKMVQSEASQASKDADEYNKNTSKQESKQITKKTYITTKQAQEITVTDYANLKTTLETSTDEELTVALEEGTYTGNGQITVNSAVKTLTIDGKGQTVNGNSQAFLKVENLDLTLKNITVTGCSNYDGSVLYQTGGQTTIINSTIKQNTLSSDGSSLGVIKVDSGSLTLDNNTFDSNSVTTSTTSRHGFIIHTTQTSKIVNNIFINNDCNDEPNGYAGLINRLVDEIHDNQYINNNLEVYVDVSFLDSRGQVVIDPHANFERDIEVKLSKNVYNDTVRNGTLRAEFGDTNPFSKDYEVIDGVAHVLITREELTTHHLSYASDGIDDVKLTYIPLDNSYDTNTENVRIISEEGAEADDIVFEVSEYNRSVIAGENITIKGNVAKKTGEGGWNDDYTEYIDYTEPFNDVLVKVIVNDKLTTCYARTNSSGDFVINCNATNVTPGKDQIYLNFKLDGPVVVNKIYGDSDESPVHVIGHTNITITAPDVGLGETIQIVTQVYNTETGNNASVASTTSNKRFSITINDENPKYVKISGGKYTYSYTPSEVGTYNVSVTWAGTNYFLGSSNTTSFKVLPSTTNMTIINNNTIKIGQDLNVHGVLSTSSGAAVKNTEVNITVGSATFTGVTVNANGKYNLTTPINELGDLTITVVYTNHTTGYSSSINKSNVNVLPKDTNMTINNNESIIVGQEVTINGTLSDELGEVIKNTYVNITVGSTPVNNVIVNENGFYETTCIIDEVGIINITVNYTSDNMNYTSSTNTSNVTVNPRNTNMTVNNNETIYVGQFVTINGTLTDELNDTVKDTYVNITVGDALIENVRVDSEGVYTTEYQINVTDTLPITVVYTNDTTRYISSTNISSVNVIPRNTNMTITNNASVLVGQEVNITGVLYDNLDEVIPNTVLTIRIGKYYINDELTVDENGRYELIYPASEVGEHNITITYTSDNTNYTSSINMSSFLVKPRATNMTIEHNGPIRVGENLTVSGYLIDELGDLVVNTHVNITVGNQKAENVIVDGNGYYEHDFTLTHNDTYIITVEYLNDSMYYISSTNKTEYKLEKVATSTNVTIVNSKVYNVTIDVVVTENTTKYNESITDGYINVTVGDKSKLYHITGNTTRITLDGDMNITTTDPLDFKVEYVENEYYYNSTGVNSTTGEVITEFTAAPLSSNITVFVAPVVQNITRNVTIFGEVFDEYGNIVEEGIVTISFNDTESVRVPFTGGRYEYNITTVTLGLNVFNVTFEPIRTQEGNILILESKNGTSFMVDKLATITNVELLNNSYNNVTIRVNVTSVLDEEHYVTTGVVYVYDFINSRLLKQEVPVGNKSVDMTLPLEPGINKLLVYYQENDKYFESNAINESAFALDKDVYVLNVEKMPSITVVEEVLSNKSGEVAIRVNVTNTTGSLIPTGHVSVFNATSGELIGEGDLDNGKADILLPGLTEPGDARINVTYEGNTHYLPSNAQGNTPGLENTTTITVTVDPRITINMTSNMTVIGKPVSIYGNVYNETGVMLSNANVIVTIDGHDYPASFDTETGEYSYIYTPTRNGTFTVNASYIKDERKQATSESLELLVNKINSTTDIVRVVNSTLGNVSLEIRVEGADGNTSMTGKLNITIEGYIPVKADYTGESIIVPLGDHIRRSGLITVLVEFQENDAYLASSIDVLIPVDAERPILELAIEKATVQVGENAVITGNLTDNMGNKISEAYIEISINDKLVTTVRTDEDGAFRYTYNTTEAGENIPVNAVYRGDDTRYDPTSNTTKFSVTKKTIYTINVSAENITYGDIETIIISLPSDANDNVNINIPDYIADTVKAENGRAVYIIGAYNISAGEYNVTVTYSDDKYATKTNTTIFKVTKSATTLTVNVTSPVKAGQSTLITGTLVDATGKPVSGEKVEVKVDNKLVASPVTNAYGKYTITFNDTIVGTHNVGASYNGNNNYMNSTAATTLTVEKLNTKITIDTIKDVPVTENVVISAKVVDEKAVPVASVLVKVSFDGKTQNVTSDNNGNIRVTIPTSTVGNKEVIVIYDGNSKYNPSNMESTARVVKNNATITLSMPSNVKVGQTATVKGKVTDKNGKTLPNIPVNVTVNGKTIPTVTDSNGNFQVEANNVREGTNNVTATASNANYNINSASGKFMATRKEAKLTVDPIKDSKLKDNITITGKLVDEQNKPISYAPVQVTVNGKTSTVTTDKDGNYQLPATGIVEGTNNVSVKYEDPEYKTQTVKASFKASTSKTVVKVPSITGVIGEDITLTAYVTDDDGKPVSGGNLVFKLNGKTLRTDGRFDTNSSPLKLHVEDGVVKYTIKADLYLRNGKNITASYSGSSKYDAAKANVATANIKKRDAQVKVTITPNKAVQNTDIVFTATLSDVTPGATNKTSLTTDANIIFKVNGVTIKDKNGKADRIRVTHSVINYAYHVPTGMGGVDDSGVKNYTVEAVYDNPVFYPDTRNSSVFHVQRSIINVNFIKTGIKNNVLSVKARFTDYENKNVVGNNKVCVKINGITYKENGEVKYFTVKDGNVDLTGIKIAKGTNVKEVMLVTGAREGYMGARATTTEITS